MKRLGWKVDRNLAQTLSLTVNQTANSTDIRSQSKLKLQFDQNPGLKLNQVVGLLFYSVDRWTRIKRQYFKNPKKTFSKLILKHSGFYLCFWVQGLDWRFSIHTWSRKIWDLKKKKKRDKINLAVQHHNKQMRADKQSTYSQYYVNVFCLFSLYGSDSI